MMKILTNLFLTNFLIFGSPIFHNFNIEYQTNILTVKETANTDSFDPDAISGLVKTISGISTAFDKGGDFFSKGKDLYESLFGDVESGSDYATKFEKLYEYHELTQTKLNALRNDNIRILNQLAANQRELKEILGDLETILFAQTISSSLSPAIATINATISEMKSDPDNMKVNWENQRIRYRDALVQILQNEFRPEFLLDVPSYVTFYLLNENPNNLKRYSKGKAKITLKPFIDKHLEFINEAYYTRERLFHNDLRDLMFYLGAYTTQLGKYKGENVYYLDNRSNHMQIQDFSKTNLDIKFSPLDEPFMSTLLNSHNYNEVRRIQHGMKSLSKSRDGFYSIKIATEKFYNRLGFDRIE